MAIEPKDSVFNRGPDNEVRVVDVYDAVTVKEAFESVAEGDVPTADAFLTAMKEMSPQQQQQLLAMAAGQEDVTLPKVSSMLSALGLAKPNNLSMSGLDGAPDRDRGDLINTLLFLHNNLAADQYHSVGGSDLSRYTQIFQRLTTALGPVSGMSSEQTGQVMGMMSLFVSAMDTDRAPDDRLSIMQAYNYDNDHQRDLMQSFLLTAIANDGDIDLAPLVIELFKATLSQRRLTIQGLLRTYRIPPDAASHRTEGDRLYKRLAEIESGWDRILWQEDEIHNLEYYRYASEDSLTVLSTLDAAPVDASIYSQYRFNTGTVKTKAWDKYPYLLL